MPNLENVLALHFREIVHDVPDQERWSKVPKTEALAIVGTLAIPAKVQAGNPIRWCWHRIEQRCIDSCLRGEWPCHRPERSTLRHVDAR